MFELGSHALNQALASLLTPSLDEAVNKILGSEELIGNTILGQLVGFGMKLGQLIRLKIQLGEVAGLDVQLGKVVGLDTQCIRSHCLVHRCTDGCDVVQFHSQQH